MTQLNRRDFTQQTIGALLTYSFLESVFSSDALGSELKPMAAEWLKQLQELGQDVKAERLPQIEWQKKVEQLFDKVSVDEFLKFVNFEKLTKNLKYRERGERAIRFKFPEVENLPRRLVFGHQIFALRKEQSVVPHGHNNMATAFLILKGEFHGRHYDRLEDDKQFMIIKPTINDKFKVGQSSTISEHKDNVHWFRGLADHSFIFNIHVLNLHEGKLSGRVYIDPKGEKLAGGKIKARKIKASEATKLYG